MFKHAFRNIILRIYKTFLFSGFRDSIQKKNLLIVLYHHISSEELESHLNFLSKQYEFVDLNYVMKFINNRENDDSSSKKVWINFDDGLQSNYGLIPVFQKLNVRPTIFLTAGLIGTCGKIWTYLFDRTKKSERAKLLDLCRLPNETRESELLAYNGHYFTKEYDERQILNEEEILTMMPFVDFQSHGMTHSIFTNCTNTELYYELKESKEIIEKITGNDCLALAYPNGKYDERVVEITNDVGYELGREAMSRGLNYKLMSPFSLRRISARPGMSVSALEREILKAELSFVKERLLIFFGCYGQKNI